ncbi:helix-turn-helix domain-containing protein [Prochlorococcus sp. MIT 1300]|uniref:helix-turn-helix domain-containing protein n=1 Tax=Prochlorococcus sp. MIT 1300 TaxID=3096218 RepID=UPI002A75FFD6|nr:helix-turn-helix domain-containing protein [Prochlorococcus sp. MIT 1300]
MKLNLSWLKSSFSSYQESNNGSKSDSKLLEAGKKLRTRREELGISLSGLAKRTRITTAVLEAIEMGWQRKLPEPAYLSSMLYLLENELGLARGELRGALKGGVKKQSNNNAKNINKFSLENIEVLTTWQGSIVYIFIMLSSLFAINHQQRLLSSLNSKTLEPIKVKLNFDASSRLIDNLDGYRPIEGSKARKPDDWFEVALDQLRIQRKKGWLEIKLNQKANIRLLSAGGDQAKLEKLKGEIRLELRPPIMLLIEPPPGKSDSIIWEGENYLHEPGTPGLYRFSEGLTKPKEDSKDLFQKTPLSP